MGIEGNGQDTRVAYGAMCTWWGTIYETARHPAGLPCCPKCHGMLFEMPNEPEFLEMASRYEADGHPGYLDMIRWTKGRCFPTMAEMEAAYLMSRGAQ